VPPIVTHFGVKYKCVSVYGGNQRQHIIKEYFRCTLPKRDGGILINFHIKEVDEPVSCATFWQASTGKSQPRRHMTPPPERFHRFIVEFSDAFSQLVLALLEFIEPRHLKLKIIRRKARDGSRRDFVMQTFSKNVIGTLNLCVVVECQRIGLKVPSWIIAPPIMTISFTFAQQRSLCFTINVDTSFRLAMQRIFTEQSLASRSTLDINTSPHSKSFWPTCTPSKQLRFNFSSGMSICVPIPTGTS